MDYPRVRFPPRPRFNRGGGRPPFNPRHQNFGRGRMTNSGHFHPTVPTSMANRKSHLSMNALQESLEDHFAPAERNIQPARQRFPPRQQQIPPSTVVSTPYNSCELLEALKSIQQVAQCCSCNNPLVTARSCDKGHGICSKCSNKRDRMCPLCESFIPPYKPITLNNIIKLLPRTCNYKGKGCECMVLANDKDHEIFCRFRNITCRVPSCERQCMAKDLLRHLEDCHGQQIIRTASHNLMLMGFDAKVEKNGFNVIVAYNNIIWQHTKIGNNCFYQFYHYVPMEKPKVEFWVVVKMYTPEKSYTANAPVHIDTSDPDPEQLFTDKDKEAFCLPREYATSFSKFYGGVKYNFEIRKRDL